MAGVLRTGLNRPLAYPVSIPLHLTTKQKRRKGQTT